MAITILQKSSGSRKRKPTMALVLSGGAVSGGAFKVGGLIALDTLFQNFSVMDFHMYLGISAGSFLAAPLAASISPQDLMRSFGGMKSRFAPFTAFDMYLPNLKELLEKSADMTSELAGMYPRVAFSMAKVISRNAAVLMSAARQSARTRGRSDLSRLEGPMRELAALGEQLPSLQSFIPSGVFDNAPLEKYMRKNLRKARAPNHFGLLERDRNRKLYIYSVDLDTAQDVVFGPDERNDATISEAVQASTALPGFYRPAVIHGRHYIDGSTKRTAPIELAMEKGADLIICYNPFRPIHHVASQRLSPRHSSLGDMGFPKVIDQALRTLLHSRLELSVKDIANDPTFKGDLLVLEPSDNNREFFSINPLSFWKRAEAARHGYMTVLRDVERNYARLSELFGTYGITLSMVAAERIAEQLAEARTAAEILEALTTT